MKQKEYLPVGISEDDFVEIVRQVSGNPAYKFVFGYNSIEDLKQQALLISIGLMGYNLLLTESGALPTAGRHLVVVSKWFSTLYIRIFDDNGEVVRDISDIDIKDKNVIEKLKDEFLLNSISWYDRVRILSTVVGITNYKPAGCKFKPRGEKPMHQQLTNFLRVWIYNRLSNYRRDNCCKYPNTGGPNQVKFNLMYPIKINSMGLANSEIFARDSELPGSASQNEIINRITKKMRKKIRSLYDKYLQGEELSPDEFKKLRQSIKRILPGNAEDYIDE